MSNDRFPDIEIYIKDTKPEKAVEWLQGCFPDLQNHGSKRNDESFRNLVVGNMNILVIAKNGGARFTSVLFEPNETPWNTDQESARAAFEFFNKEIRCSIGAWNTGDDVVDTYWRISKHGEGEFDWETQDPDEM